MLRHIAWKTISFPLFPIFFLFSIEKTQCSHFIAYRIVKSNISDSCISLDHSILIWRAARIPEKAGHMFICVHARDIYGHYNRTNKFFYITADICIKFSAHANQLFKRLSSISRFCFFFSLSISCCSNVQFETQNFP